MLTVKSCSSCALGFVVAVGLQASAFAQGGFDGPGRYEIVNVGSGKVIDLDRNDQSTVIQFSGRGTDNQTWDVERASSGYYFLRNGMNGYALQADNDRNSSPLRGVPFNGSSAQQWRIERGKDGNAVIVNRNGKVIDVPDGTREDGARLQVYGTTGDDNQRFTFRRVSGGVFGRDTTDRGRYNTRDRDYRGRDNRDYRDRDRGSVFDSRTQADSYYDERDRTYRMNGDGVCFYRDRNYQGEAFCVRAGETIRNVGPQFNDAFSSVRFFGRTRNVEIYENEELGGDHVRIRGDEPDLGRVRSNRGGSFNDRITSFRVD
jgi:hypothetical protein